MNSKPHDCTEDSKNPDSETPGSETPGSETPQVDYNGDGVTDLVLIVDDSETGRALMASVCQKDGFDVQLASDANTALEKIQQRVPDVVLTDLDMPGMTGLQLVQTLRGTHPSLPVVLVTAKGSEDTAAEALRVGAASYIPKRDLEEHLSSVIRQVLTTGSAIKSAQAIGKLATRCSIEWKVGNHDSIVPKLIARIEAVLVELGLFDEGERMQIAMALDEAMLNAIIHGNLEVPSSLREEEEGVPYFKLIEDRLNDPKYANRRMTVAIDATAEQATFRITDEGPGYDPTSLTDATDAEHIEGVGGRGMLMIDAFMDEVQLNARGNEITMIKRPTPTDLAEDENGVDDEAALENEEAP